MSMQRLFRGLFVVRPTKVTYNPYRYFNKSMLWLRKNWWKLIGGLIISFFIFGVFLRLTGTFTIYEETGVTPVKGRKIGGGVFDFIWWLRGQPPGWESEPDGIGILPSKANEGLNGPINWWFLPFEFLLVDVLVYLPGVFFGGVDFGLFDIPQIGIFLAETGGKALVDFVILLICIVPLIILGFLLTFFGPFIFMRLFQSGNILLRLLATLMIAIPIMVGIMLIFMGPEAFMDFIGGIFGRAKEKLGGP